MKKCVMRIVSIMVFFGMLLSGCGKDYNSQSIENRDYALDMRVSKDIVGYRFNFEVADLTDYKGDSGKSMKKEEFSCSADGIEAATKKYFEENERQLDIGHVNKVWLEGSYEDYSDLLLELSHLPYFPKSVEVLYGEGEKAVMRKLISKVLSK